MALENKTNHRNDSKGIYIFSMLWYGIPLYTQHREELERGTRSGKKLTYGGSPHSGDVTPSQADIASIREMQRAMDRLLTVFVQPEADMRNATNR